MKSKLIAIVLALFSASGLVTTDRSLSNERAKRVEPSAQRLAISEYGTLLGVFDADGKSRFGKLELDGFNVKYETKGMKTGLVSAIGTRVTKGLQSGQVKVNEQSTSVTVRTGDNTLEITSYFILDEAAQKLTIGRKFRNVSDKKVSLQWTLQYVDPKLIVEAHARRALPNLMQAAHGRIKAGRLVSDCQVIAKCPVPPVPCPPPMFCPEPSPWMTTLATKRGERINLRWGSRTLVKSSGGAATQPASESHFVIQLDLR